MTVSKTSVAKTSAVAQSNSSAATKPPSEKALLSRFYAVTLAKKHTPATAAQLKGEFKKCVLDDRARGADVTGPFVFELKGEKYIGYSFESGRDDSGTLVAKLNDPKGALIARDLNRC